MLQHCLSVCVCRRFRGLGTRRHLMIPLVCAERCWAQAMELKTQQEEQPIPQKRQHQIRRLAKVSRLLGTHGLL